MDQKKIRAFAGTALLAGVIAFMGTGAVQAQSVTPSEAAHHVIEQELQSHVPGQAVYAQNGVVIRSGIIREKDLLIHYPQVRVMGKPEVSRRITRYFEKQAEISRENYNKANTMEEKLTSRVDFAVSYHGERYLSFQTYGYDFVERAAHPTSWELGKTFDLETGKLVPWQKVLTPAVGTLPWTRSTRPCGIQITEKGTISSRISRAWKNCRKTIIWTRKDISILSSDNMKLPLMLWVSST